MKTTLYYVILRGVPGFRNCYLNLDVNGDEIVHSRPHLFVTDAGAKHAGELFTITHGGTARVHSTQLTSP